MPEEINRVLADRLSTLLFCPSRAAVENLHMEGITGGVHLVGDVMVDAVRHHVADARPPDLTEAFALATVHRQENTDDPARLRTIVATLARAPLPVVLPLHPRTSRALARLGVEATGSLRPVEPLTYLELLGYLRACRFVLTDSGGLQKEAYVLGKRCVTLRGETEWTELVEAGANRVVDAGPDAIAGAMRWADAPGSVIEPIYGDGDAGRRIIDTLLQAAAAAG